MTVRTARLGDAGDSVTCIQQALIAQGLLSGTASGTFDSATQEAVRKLQDANESMFVDGVVGRETASGPRHLARRGIARRPHAAAGAGAVDSLGYPLSLGRVHRRRAPRRCRRTPASGRRVVYSRAGQRVWAVDNDDRSSARGWSRAASTTTRPRACTRCTASRQMSTAWNGKAYPAA